MIFAQLLEENPMKMRKCFTILRIVCAFLSQAGARLLAGPGDVLWDHPFQIEGGYEGWGQKLLVSA
jgi:hypothetical protein